MRCFGQNNLIFDTFRGVPSLRAYDTSFIHTAQIPIDVFFNVSEPEREINVVGWAPIGLFLLRSSIYVTFGNNKVETELSSFDSTFVVDPGGRLNHLIGFLLARLGNSGLKYQHSFCDLTQEIGIDTAH